MTMMTWWKEKAWPWLRKWGGALFGGIVALLLLLIGGGWLWRRQKGKIGKLKDSLAVAEAITEIVRLRALRVGVAEAVGEKDEAIEVIDRELQENQRRIVEAHEGGEGLSDEEMLAEFASLGI